MARPQRDMVSERQSKDGGQERYEEVVSSLGLSHILNSTVGNDFIPGISGGERKRLSIAEILLRDSALQCWDNSTRGLDSSNALQFVSTLRRNTAKYHTAAVVTLYQSSQTIYEVFRPP